jgi:hypothetical protein
MAGWIGGTWTPGDADCRITAPVNSDLRQLEISLNALMTGLSYVLAGMTRASADGPMTTTVLSNGTTVTLACTASIIEINGVNGSVAAETAAAFGALGTIPQNKYGLIGVERIANGTTTFTSAADSFTTGYDTEALAIAALPAQSANKALVGYITISSTHASGWVTGTDGMLGQTGGNPATFTQFYSVPGAADTTNFTNALQIANQAGTVITTTAG